ncbi:unnamed protein product [marine sediment metagenome]|uniref:Uncharacterized protein n=1 Tax=marine sediment metagenome TaxID=412755 RepID=X1HEU1_9ZZZZ
MLEWFKKHTTILVTTLTCIAFMLYCYGCEPKVRSLIDRDQLINRQELQLELDQFIGMAQLRMADLDKQDNLRAIILQNALILVQGQPFNPLGILTAIASVYGITQAGKNVTNVVKTVRNKGKLNNGTG